MANGAAVSGQGAAFAHGTKCLCDLIQISFFFNDYYFNSFSFSFFFLGDWEESNEGNTDPAKAPCRGFANMSMHEHTRSPTWSRT